MTEESLATEFQRKHPIAMWRAYTSLRFYGWWDRFKYRHPRLITEGEATARMVDREFRGYPLVEDFETVEDAVEMLQRIWDVIDDWDGGRRNVARYIGVSPEGTA